LVDSRPAISLGLIVATADGGIELPLGDVDFVLSKLWLAKHLDGQAQHVREVTL
jgi:hypothetical protein